MTVKIKNILLVSLAWLTAGLLYSAQSYYYRTQIGQEVEWLNTILVDTPYFLFWAVFTPLPVFFLRRFPYSRKGVIRFILVHVFVALLVSFSQAFIYNGFRLIVTGSEFTLSRTWLNAVANVDYGLLVYFVILLITGVYDYYVRFQKLETTLAQSQLENVRVRLQPHFLFNTLNSIAVLIKENPAAAAETVRDLSDLLRHVLKNMENQFNTLGSEIGFIKKYLAIERIRFGDRLQISIDYTPQLDEILVPSLILQPLVENAILHGIARHPGNGYLQLEISRLQDRLVCYITNNGLLDETELHNGLGLKITQDRLNALYGKEYRMEIRKTSQDGIRATLDIPVLQESN